MITVLDGGMGQELIRRGVATRSELWSAQALLDAPGMVADVHRDYISAGARIIITNSYSTIPSYLSKVGMADRFEELSILAARIAREVADDSEHDVLVAGSMPPLDESYRADLVPPDEIAMPIYRAIGTAINPYVDLFICETMSCVREAHNAVAAATEISAGGKRVFVSWSLDENPGSGLRSRESVADAFAALEEFNVQAFLFNCTSPRSARELSILAARIAREVADDSEHDVLVAGSMPPLDESYRADLVPPDEIAMPIYRAIGTAINPYVDLFICETMSCVREAHNAVAAATEISAGGKRVFVSWSLDENPGSGLRSRESVADAFAALEEFNVQAFLFNCTSPEAISAGLAELRPLTDKPIGGYPNRLHIPEGWTLDDNVKASYYEISTEEYVAATKRWTELGATIIGGCCGIGPEYISALRDSLSA